MIIGLVGKARSGKDTFASLLPGFERHAFADALKDAFAAYHRIPRCWCDGVDEDGTPIDREKFWAYHSRRDAGGVMEPVTIRQGLQRFGMAMRDTFGDDFWLARLVERVGSFRQDIVITDVRFDNEVDLIRGLGGMIVGIFRPECEEVSAHASEELANRVAEVADRLIINDGTIDDLRIQAEGLIA